MRAGEISMKTCVILCGGKSSRFGSDKTLFPFRGHPSMTHFLFSRLSCEFERVFACAKSSKFNPPLPMIYDEFEEFSPMGALYSALKPFSGERIFIIPADMPFVEISTIRALSEQEGQICVAGDEAHRHSLCGFFDAALAPRALELYRTGEHKIGALIGSANSKVLNFKNKEQFLNINYQNDLKGVDEI